MERQRDEALEHAKSAAAAAAEQAAAVADGAASSALHRSAERGDLAAVLAILDGAHGEASKRFHGSEAAACPGSHSGTVLVDSRDQYGCTPLHYSSCATVTKALLEARADVDARDGDGLTPLHHASALGLGSGLCTERAANGGRGVAVANSSYTVGAVLLEAGANTTCCDQMQRSALSYACAEDGCGRLAYAIVCQMLRDNELATKADGSGGAEDGSFQVPVGLDMDVNGWTPLRHAVTHGRIEAVIGMLDASLRLCQDVEPHGRAAGAESEKLANTLPSFGLDEDLPAMVGIARANGHFPLAQLLAMFHQQRRGSGRAVGPAMRLRLSANHLAALVISARPPISALALIAGPDGRPSTDTFDVHGAVAEVAAFVLKQRHAFLGGLHSKGSACSSHGGAHRQEGVCWVGLLDVELCATILHIHSRSRAVGLLPYINCH